MIIDAVVNKIIFRNENNNYTVVVARSNHKQIVIICYFPKLFEGEEIRCEGDFKLNNFGYQFYAESVETINSTSNANLINFLSSGIIKGIGVSTAKNIVEKFGNDTFKILEKSPYRITEVKGIGDSRASLIINCYNEIIGLRNTIFQLQKFGFTPNECIKISNYYGNEAINVVSKNPYSLIEDIDGIGFLIADKIAIKAGFKHDSEYRIQSAVLYYLKNHIVSLGHTTYPQESLINDLETLLGLDKIIINGFISKMLYNGEIKLTTHKDNNYISLPYFYNIEREIAININKRLNNKILLNEVCVTIDNINQSLDNIQKNAIYNTVNNNITIITGGPGTGKTTIIKYIITIYSNYKIILCAPTGRAAKRISEEACFEAFTIHKTLEFNFEEHCFNKNEDNPLECDIIVIDEMSMVDTMLFYHLLKAIPINAKIILIGDAYQLPSIGPGNILNDLIKSNKIICTRLEKIYRQKEKSLIIKNSKLIKDGIMPKVNENNSDFFFIEAKSTDKTQSIIIDLFTNRLPKFFKINKNDKLKIFSTIQVLAPQKQTNCGTIELNNIIQNIYKDKDEQKEFTFAGKTYYIGDKVIQIKNDYDMEYEYEDTDIKDKGIFNGEIGIVVDLNDNELFIKFDDGKIAKYNNTNIDNISLAYCLTIHKSQGSEFSAVIIPIYFGSSLLQTRNLIYTAVTRAKDLIVLVGNSKALSAMINNVCTIQRYTLLTKFLEYY